MKHVCLCLAVCLAAPLAQAAEERKPVRTYTNEDLLRVSPLRDETGAASRPGPPPAPDRAPRDEPGRRGEQYWRHEAERVRERLWPLREKAEALRVQIAEARRRATEAGGARRKAAAGPSPEVLESRLRLVEREIREREERLEERARREGALPGWIR